MRSHRTAVAVLCLVLRTTSAYAQETNTELSKMTIIASAHVQGSPFYIWHPLPAVNDILWAKYLAILCAPYWTRAYWKEWGEGARGLPFATFGSDCSYQLRHWPLYSRVSFQIREGKYRLYLWYENGRVMKHEYEGPKTKLSETVPLTAPVN